MTENIVSQIRGSIPLKTAKVLMDRVEEYARQKGLACVIAVDDAHGNPIAVHVMEDAFLVSYEVATQKAYTAVAVKMSTMQVHEMIQPGGTFYGLESMKNGRIIGFGGGSSIDCAKAVGARIAKPRQSLSQMEGILKVHKRLPTLIAIPTTAGTGSEATLAAICCTPLISQALPFPNPMSDMSTLSLIRSAESTTSRTDWQTPFCSRMYSRHTDRVSIKNCTNCLSASVCPAERTPIRSVRRPFSARSAR